MTLRTAKRRRRRARTVWSMRRFDLHDLSEQWVIRQRENFRAALEAAFARMSIPITDYQDGTNP